VFICFPETFLAFSSHYRFGVTIQIPNTFESMTKRGGGCGWGREEFRIEYHKGDYLQSELRDASSNIKVDIL
jgi:hypothetical protein